MSNVYVNKKIVRRGADCVILRTYDNCYRTFNYYLFSNEGDIILQATNCNCPRIPSVITAEFEKFSLEEKHKKEKEEFKAWLKNEGYTE
jgi:hypothetical protein